MLNPRYKNFFSIEISFLRSSLISLMQEPFYVDYKSIEFPLEDNLRLLRFDFLKSDMEKSFFNELNSKEIDCLIIDNFFEARFGVASFDGILLTNNTWDLPETEFYKNTNSITEFSMDIDEGIYMELFSKNCNLFFDFMKSNYPNIRIILNKARLSCIVRKTDSSFYISEDYEIYAKKYNTILDKLDSYIENNFDVGILEFDFQNCYCRPDHPWGIGPNHYNSFYYSYLTKQLLDIVSPEKTFDYLVENNFPIYVGSPLASSTPEYGKPGIMEYINTNINTIKTINVKNAALLDVTKLSVSSFLVYFFENFSIIIDPNIVNSIVEEININILDNNS